jgi:flagellin
LTTTAAFTFQIGANTGQTASIATTDISITAGVSGISGTAASALVTTAAAENSAKISALDTAIQSINSSRASLGAIQNRFEYTVSFLQAASENQQAARGRIMDADFATETSNLSRAQILKQAGTAMVAQANQLPQGVLALLR